MDGGAGGGRQEEREERWLRGQGEGAVGGEVKWGKGEGGGGRSEGVKGRSGGGSCGCLGRCCSIPGQQGTVFLLEQRPMASAWTDLEEAEGEASLRT